METSGRPSGHEQSEHARRDLRQREPYSYSVDSAGDIIVGDADGVVVVAARKAEEVLRIGQAIIRYEEELLGRVESGLSQKEIFQLNEQFESLRRTHIDREESS